MQVLFELARHHAPSTIFLDEVDALMGARGGENEHEASRRLKTELLVQLDGLASGGDSAPQVGCSAATEVPHRHCRFENAGAWWGQHLPPQAPKTLPHPAFCCQVFVLAATNLPWELDQALLRRLDKRVMVGLPDAEAREAMLRVGAWAALRRPAAAAAVTWRFVCAGAGAQALATDHLRQHGQDLFCWCRQCGAAAE